MSSPTGYYYSKLTCAQANEVDRIMRLGSTLISTQELKLRDEIARLLLNGEPRG